jgi:RNA polymerase sigma factor (sigma-70 family)
METSCSDCELLKLATHGDAVAFERLVTAHRGAMFSAAWQLLPSREDCEDAIQDALITLWRNCLLQADRLRAIRSPLWLLMATAREAAGHIVRRRQAVRRGGKDVCAFDVEVRRSLYGLLAHKHAGTAVETREPSPDHDAGFKRLGMVQRLAPQLPPALLGPLNAFYCGGESIQSMAKRRGCSTDTVKRTLSAGIQTLRYLAAKDPENAELAVA